MLYILDANILITAHNNYYPIDTVPEFWEWLCYQGEKGILKIPVEIIEEILEGPKEGDLLQIWLKDKSNRDHLELKEDVDGHILEKVVLSGYANDLTDDEFEQIGRDPFLIAYGLAANSRCVVTVETSAPSKKRHNKKVPDVCAAFNLPCTGPFKLYRELGFSTSWART